MRLVFRGEGDVFGNQAEILRDLADRRVRVGDPVTARDAFHVRPGHADISIALGKGHAHRQFQPHARIGGHEGRAGFRIAEDVQLCRRQREPGLAGVFAMIDHCEDAQRAPAERASQTLFGLRETALDIEEQGLRARRRRGFTKDGGFGRLALQGAARRAIGTGGHSGGGQDDQGSRKRFHDGLPVECFCRGLWRRMQAGPDIEA